MRNTLFDVLHLVEWNEDKPNKSQHYVHTAVELATRLITSERITHALPHDGSHAFPLCS
jgi:hypothetical protein